MSRPFNAARYTGLLEGLEITELLLSQVGAGNLASRIDAQYFSKSALATEQEIKRGNWAELKQISSSIESFGAYALTNEFSYVEDGVPFLRCLNIRNGFTDFSNALHITPEANKLLTKSAVRPGMVLLTMSGSVGNASVALPSWIYPINSNQDIAKISPADGVDSYYLAAFLGSRFGRAQMERLPVGSVQQHIFLWMIERLLISRLSAEAERKIGLCVCAAYELERTAVISIQAAEQALLNALGLADWQPPQPLSYVRSSKEAFEAGRWDAEYFSPATHAILGELSKQGDISLGEICKVLTGFAWKSDQFIEHGDGTGAPFVRIRDCKPGAIWANELDMLESSYALAQGQSRAQPGDLVVGMDGLKWFYASQLMDACYINQRVAWLSPQDDAFTSEYLMTVINALIGQRQLLSRMTIAHTVGHITLEDLRNLRIPILSEKQRSEISGYAQMAIENKQRAAHLLDAAKRAVEIAIEDSEATALAYLEAAQAATA